MTIDTAIPRSQLVRRASLRRCLLVVLVLHSAARVVLAAAGLTFCTEHTAAIMHFPELDLLRDRLGETLWHMHGQPPGMSLWFGLLMALFGDSWLVALEWSFHALAAAAALAITAIVHRAGRAPALAVAAGVLFSLLPGVLVYEHYAFSTLPVLACLLFAFVTLQRAFGEHGRARDLAFALTWLAVVVNLRNVFHVVIFAALALLAVLLARLSLRRALAALLLPTMLATAPYWKNLAMHGRFEASSWIGFGLARKTYHQQPLPERQQLVATGQLAPIAGVPVFGTVDEFAVVLGLPAPTGVPLLDRKTKASGHPNYHHAIYRIASLAMRDEALRNIARFPDRYLANCRATLRQLFEPAAAWGPVTTPRTQLGRYGELVDAALHAPWPLPLRPNAWALLAAVVLLVGGARGLRALWRPATARPDDRLLACVTAALVCLYATAVLLDTNETMRHRLKGDGLLWLGALLVLPGRTRQA